MNGKVFNGHGERLERVSARKEYMFLDLSYKNIRIDEARIEAM